MQHVMCEIDSLQHRHYLSALAELRHLDHPLLGPPLLDGLHLPDQLVLVIPVVLVGLGAEQLVLLSSNLVLGNLHTFKAFIMLSVKNK